jgi:N-ethylmaleimide reductase
MSEALLFSPFALGPVTLKNRIVMAPMTRSRAIGNVPNALMARYYAQRAEAGLIVAEGTSPAPNGLGYARIPGLFNEAQVAGWQKVTSSVHREGGHVFLQIMHSGRVGHPGNLPAGARLLAPSAVAWEGKTYVDGLGELPVPLAEAMTETDIGETIDAYARSAGLAIDAGFDGVEIQAANGSLIDQFLDVSANERADTWGGSPENRIRFAVEVTRRVASTIGPERVGVRVSPCGAINGMNPSDERVEEVHALLARALARLRIVYVHLVDHHTAFGTPEVRPAAKRAIREAFPGPLILAGGYDRERATRDLAERRGDLVAFGRAFVANPRLVSKLRRGEPLASPNAATYYTAGEEGYTDYPGDAEASPTPGL